MLQISKHCAILFALLVLVSCFNQSLSAESACADWASYKDEKCFKVVDDTLRTYDEAEKACVKLENSPTLAIIHSQEEQDFLVNYLFRTLKKVDNVWVGAKYSNNAFHWIDNSSLTFTNWDAKGAHNKANYCVELLSDELTLGKWTDGPCERKNAFVCQKAQTWTVARLQETLLETRKQFTDALDVANKKLTDYKRELDEANKNQKQEFDGKIKILEKNQVPVGFLYTQLPNEKPPTSIWPSMNWTDVSSNFAGVFFRVEGGGSEPFGQTQVENDWRVIRIERSTDFAKTVSENITINSNTVGQNTKTSEWVYTGDLANERNYYNHFRLVTTTGEIRPRNMAIRVWKRI